MIHFHKWSNWQDVKIGDKVGPTVHTGLFVLVRQVITQQRRCAVCNLVKTRVA